jgi:hypothetical protein
VPGDQLVQFVRTGAEVEGVAWDVGVLERPPMATVPEYRARREVRTPGAPR